MVQWCLMHPWMTFFLLWWMTYVLDNMFVNLCRLINNMMKAHLAKHNIEVKEEEK